MPASATVPMSVSSEILAPMIATPMSTPMIENGMVNITTSGCTQERKRPPRMT